VNALLPRRIHIFGASGSGTTTLAAALAERHGHRHLDTDDFYWLPTDPPYQTSRPRDERLRRLQQALAASASWVLSGSLCGWGDPLIPAFELVVFLAIPSDVRMRRLQSRELQRYGREAIAPGGPRHHASADFLDWAARYDTGGLDIRSRALHEAWIGKLGSPVLRLEGDRPVAAHLTEIERSQR
jgi:adenylate kinase family enzyme